MLNKLSIQEFERIADETAEESIKDLYRACDWALDGYEITQNFNDLHGLLMKAVTKRIAIKMGVTKENTK
tara:strand:- start:180 stop:389 length:210 start_codon:yes stop_codon:yes gene_type:complete